MKHLMQAHMAAFMAKVAVFGAYEKREEPTAASLAEAITKIGTAFEEYKKTNDARIEAVKSGNSTADIDAKLEKIDADLNALEEVKGKLEQMETKLSRPSHDDFVSDRKQSGESKEDAEYRHAFFDWMRNPKDFDKQKKAQEKAKALEAKKTTLEGKAAATSSLTGAAGGFALPEIVENAILRLGVDVSGVRSIAKVVQVGSPDYKELVDINGATFEWIGEGDTRAQTNTPDLYEVAPTFGMASAKPQATEESLDDLFFNVEDWLVGSVREAFDQGEGAAFISGNGTKKPTGFLAGPAPVATTDATRAFGTLQYVASGQAAALPASLDVMNDLVYSLRARYRNNATWVTNKAVLSALRKYKDTTNQYLWQPAVAAGQPSTFMGYAVSEMEDMPAVAANAFPIAFGDFNEGYLIADLVGLRITRDDITTPGYVKFYVRKRVGGKLRNTQAIKVLKISAS